MDMSSIELKPDLADGIIEDRPVVPSHDAGNRGKEEGEKGGDQVCC